jgi:hypothetical protein
MVQHIRETAYLESRDDRIEEIQEEDRQYYDEALSWMREDRALMQVYVDTLYHKLLAAGITDVAPPPTMKPQPQRRRVGEGSTSNEEEKSDG